jgi:DNA-binding FadR family transcriptional regulator
MSSLYFEFARITFREVADTRLAMEPIVARLAAERADATDIAALRRLIDPRTYDSYVNAGSEFHRVLGRVSANGILALFTNAVQDILTERTALATHPESRREGVFHEHEEIVAAIERNDGPAAEDAMRRHMQEFVDYLNRDHPQMLDEIVGRRW